MIEGFNDIQKKFQEILNTKNWNKLLEDFKKADKIYLIGNGGNWAICSHGACDMNRLFSRFNINKLVMSLDSQSMITSISNDFGYNHLFTKWLDTFEKTDSIGKNPLIIGVSCSGTSKNIVSPLFWANKKKYNTCLISGIKSTILGKETNEIVIDTNYFHTGEILTLMLFYELIHYMGAKCPLIKDEIIRKGTAQPLARNI